MVLVRFKPLQPYIDPIRTRPPHCGVRRTSTSLPFLIFKFLVSVLGLLLCILDVFPETTKVMNENLSVHNDFKDKDKDPWRRWRRRPVEPWSEQDLEYGFEAVEVWPEKPWCKPFCGVIGHFWKHFYSMLKTWGFPFFEKYYFKSFDLVWPLFDKTFTSVNQERTLPWTDKF